MNRLRFGTAGIPISAKGGDTAAGISTVNDLGLHAMELEFVRNVNITEERAPTVKKAAEENDVTLTCHASYFINLNAKEDEKREASRGRLVKAAHIASLCGGWSTCVHAGSYLGMEKEPVYKTVKKQLELAAEEVKSHGDEIWIRPETAGKKAQFARLDVLLKLASEIDMVMPCIDFGHMHAIDGENNTYDEFSAILQQVEKVLGPEGLHNMHIHAEGISYTDKGEKSHLNLNDSDLNYKEMLRAWRDHNIKGVIICESPNMEEDAKLMQGIYNGKQ